MTKTRKSSKKATSSRKGKPTTRKATSRRANSTQTTTTTTTTSTTTPTTQQEGTQTTQTYISHFHGIPISKYFQERIDEMETLVLDFEEVDPAEARRFRSPKSFSEHVSLLAEKVRNMYLQQPSWKTGLELLLAFAITLFRHDSWIRDGGYWVYRFNAAYFLGEDLGHVLSKSDEDLGIDSKFTRESILAFLGELKGKMDSFPGFAKDRDPVFNFA